MGKKWTRPGDSSAPRNKQDGVQGHWRASGADDGEEAGALTEIRKQEGHLPSSPGLGGLDLYAQVKMELFLSVLEGKWCYWVNLLVKGEGTSWWEMKELAQGNVHVYEEVWGGRGSKVNTEREKWAKEVAVGPRKLRVSEVKQPRISQEMRPSGRTLVRSRDGWGTSPQLGERSSCTLAGATHPSWWRWGQMPPARASIIINSSGSSPQIWVWISSSRWEIWQSQEWVLLLSVGEAATEKIPDGGVIV